MEPKKLICPYCEKTFIQKHKNAKFCCPEHQVMNNNNTYRLKKKSVDAEKLKCILKNEDFLRKFCGRGLYFTRKELSRLNYSINDYNDFKKIAHEYFFLVRNLVLVFDTYSQLYRIESRMNNLAVFPIKFTLMEAIEYVQKLRSVKVS